MAILDTPQELNALWKRFNAKPDSLTLNEYKTIADSAQTLYRKNLLSASEAQKMMTAVSKYT